MPNFVISVAYQNEQECDAMLSYVETVANEFLAEGKALTFPTTVAGSDGVFRNIIPVSSTAAGNDILNNIYLAAKQQNISVVCTSVDIENPDPIQTSNRS